MDMWYWRKENFEGLADIAAVMAERPELSKFAEYCRLREQGLRKQAFATLHDFITACAAWEVGRRREFVDWILNLQHSRSEIFDLIPNPLRVRLIEPTIENWLAEEPLNPVPHRWLGTLEGWQEAIRLDPNEQIARELLIGVITRGVEYAVHEIPAGYLGDAEGDATALDEANRVLGGLKNPAKRNLLAAEIAALSEKVDLYRQYLSEDSALCFWDWYELNFGSEEGESETE